MDVAACCDVLEDTQCAGSLHAAIEVCHQLGFDAVELSVPHVRRSGVAPAQIRHWCQNLGMRICGVHNSLPDDFTIFDEHGRPRTAFHDHLRHALETAAALGAPVVTIGIGSSRRIPLGYDREQITMRYIHALLGVIDQFVQARVSASIEIISGRTAGLFNTAEETLAWLIKADSPWVGMTCDTFQSLQQGVDPCSDIPKGLPRLAHLHLAEQSRRPPGEGRIDFERLFRTLIHSGYHGSVSIELKPPSAIFTGSTDPVADLTIGLKHVRTCLQQATAHKARRPL